MTSATPTTTCYSDQVHASKNLGVAAATTTSVTASSAISPTRKAANLIQCGSPDLAIHVLPGNNRGDEAQGGSLATGRQRVYRH